MRRPELEPGGWAFEFANANYPDIDDTAEVVIALNTVNHPDPVRVREAIERGVRWLTGMRSSDGGWGAFDVDNCRTLIRDLPFCDFGEVIDPPSADVTAHVVEMLGALGRTADPLTQRGVRWLLENQEPGGSWFGRWGVNHRLRHRRGRPAWSPPASRIAAPRSGARSAGSSSTRTRTAAGARTAAPTTIRPGSAAARAPPRRRHGRCWRSMRRASGRLRGVQRGVDWLVVNQREDGGWDEPYHTGTGFPSDFYIKYHLYRLIFPVMALGRCAR